MSASGHRALLGPAPLLAIVVLSAACLAACVHPAAKGCQPLCCAPAAEDEMIPLEVGSAPVFAVAGAIFLITEGEDAGGEVDGRSGTITPPSAPPQRGETPVSAPLHWRHEREP